MAPCCIKGCNNRGEQRSKKNSGISYHLFPRDSIKRKKWLEAIARRNWTPSNSTVVCSHHFQNDCFYTTQCGLKRLVNNAVPTIKIKNTQNATENSKGKMSFQILEMVNVTEDDTQKAKELATQLIKLTNIYEKQKKVLRNLRQKTKRQESKLQNIVQIQDQPSRTEIKFETEVTAEPLDNDNYDSELKDPLS